MDMHSLSTGSGSAVGNDDALGMGPRVGCEWLWSTGRGIHLHTI